VKPEECKGCPLYAARGPVFGDGPRDARLVFVGEAPGVDEVARGKPFVGRAGAVFNIALSAAGVSRGLCYVTNTVKCLPPHPYRANTFRKPTQSEVEFCATRYLDVELREIKPNVVVAMGDSAFRWMARDGKQRSILEWRGCVMEVDLDQEAVGRVETGGRSKESTLRALLHGAVYTPWEGA